MDIVNTLLRAKADANATNRNGETPVYLAVELGKYFHSTTLKFNQINIITKTFNLQVKSTLWICLSDESYFTILQLKMEIHHLLLQSKLVDVSSFINI